MEFQHVKGYKDKIGNASAEALAKYYIFLSLILYPDNHGCKFLCMNPKASSVAFSN